MLKKIIQVKRVLFYFQKTNPFYQGKMKKLDQKTEDQQVDEHVHLTYDASAPDIPEEEVIFHAQSVSSEH